MKPDDNDHDYSQRDQHFENYGNYSRTLRAWLVSYGIGAPVLFLTNDKVTENIARSGNARLIVATFLGGVALQIMFALINKWCAWHMYRGAGDPKYQSGWLYRYWEFINSQSWIDYLIDLISVSGFFLATWLVLDSMFKV